jgi:CubicO group peptidase (beta-lactamase class C family)
MEKSLAGAPLSKDRLGRLREVMTGYVERGEVPGLVALVARRDEIHVEALGLSDLAARTPMRRDSLFRVASMTKPVTAVATMILIEEARLGLDDPVERWLPELADRRVLRSLEGPLDDTVPAARPITVRDLLTFAMGLGAVMAPPGRYPIQAAMAEAGLAPGPVPFQAGPDRWLAGLGGLPLLHQPGEAWMYHTGSDVLGVLIARVAGVGFGEFLKERIFAPLGMKDTAFHAAGSRLDRLATAYARDPKTGSLGEFDGADGAWSRPPQFESGGGGLVSTAGDLLAFGRMLLNFGRTGRERVLSRPSVELMTTDQLTAAQKAAPLSRFYPGFWEIYGWGFGVSIVTRRDGISATPGRYGWDGGLGTSWRNDPAWDMTCILLTQRMMRGPADTRITEDFLTLAYAALDD